MKVCGIILAAGYSSRFGDYKLIMPVGCDSVVISSIKRMRAFCDKIIVVGGYKIDTLREHLKSVNDIEIVFNENYDKSMFTSVKKGVSMVDGDFFFLSPADLPFISENTYKIMISEVSKMDVDILIPAYNNRRGHPVLINSKFKSEILSYPNDYNLRDFINSKKPIILSVDDQGILHDIDTKEEYNELRGFYERINQ